MGLCRERVDSTAPTLNRALRNPSVSPPAPQKGRSAQQIRSLVEGLRNIAASLADADPKLKGLIYEELGVT
jgi:hypothetical protein